jgi:hypothetical protein
MGMRERKVDDDGERAHVRFGHSRWLMVQLLINDGALQTRGPRVRDARPLLSEFLLRVVVAAGSLHRRSLPCCSRCCVLVAVPRKGPRAQASNLLPWSITDISPLQGLLIIISIISCERYDGES